MLVGIDIGTQSLKAVVTDRELRVLGAAAGSYEVSLPAPGRAEQDPELWERALGPTVAAALARAGVEARRVEALAIAGQLDGCVAVDSAGRPIAPCLIWMDRRAESELLDLDTGRIGALTGLVPDPGHMGAKIRWLARHLGPRAARFHQPTSYLVERLTGRAVLDHALASTTMLWALQAGDLDHWLLEQFEVRREQLPALAEATDLAGPLSATGAALTGLPAGTAVAVGTGDDFASPLGGGLVVPGRLVAVLGTAEVVGALHATPVRDPGHLVEPHRYPGGGWLIENPGWLSGGTIDWLCRLLGFAHPAALDQAAATVPPGAGGVTFLPALTGAMAPRWASTARGCFYGLTPAHGPAHLARAVLEGTAFAMRDVLERLLALGVSVEAILLLGGGARSTLWPRIRADVAGLPAQRPAIVDTSPLGAAMLAAVAGGLQPDLAACARRIGSALESTEPDPAARAAYDDAYGSYRALFSSLEPMFERPGA